VAGSAMRAGSIRPDRPFPDPRRHGSVPATFDLLALPDLDRSGGVCRGDGFSPVREIGSGSAQNQHLQGVQGSGMDAAVECSCSWMGGRFHFVPVRFPDPDDRFSCAGSNDLASDARGLPSSADRPVPRKSHVFLVSACDANSGSRENLLEPEVRSSRTASRPGRSPWQEMNRNCHRVTARSCSPCGRKDRSKPGRVHPTPRISPSENHLFSLVCW